MKYFMKNKTLLLIFSSFLILCACTTSPTGRRQLKLYPADQMNEMGIQAFDSMKDEQKVSTAKVENKFVQCVAGLVAQQVPDSVYSGKWEVVVFDDEQVNAFALPGGKIGVYTGLLNVTENQHQLAAVIGHEVGHVIAGHSNERMSNSTLIGIGMEATDQLLKANKVAYNAGIMAALGFGTQVGIQLPFSRTHESEADIIGLDLMAKAGFDPEQSVNLWQNMEKASYGQRQPELLSTHPSPQSRIKDLQQHMSQAKALQSSSQQHPNCTKG